MVLIEMAESFFDKGGTLIPCQWDTTFNAQYATKGANGVEWPNRLHDFEGTKWKDWT
jgi:hypothetical protein